MIRRRRLLAAAAAGAALPLHGLAAQSWPSRHLRIVVPLPPGGGYDYIARSLSEPLGQRLQQPVIVENRAGADGRLGLGYLARQPTDGHTVGIISLTNVIQPSLFKEMPYDIVNDFTPIGMVAHAPAVLVIGPGLPGPRTAAEFFDATRRQPGAITFGSTGVGSTFHIGSELLKAALRLDMLHVVYKGSAPLITALLSGEVQSAVVNLGPYLPHINAGKLRALGALTEERIRSLPQVPTLNEVLGQKQLSMLTWLGLVAPAGAPRTAVERLSSELRAVLADPVFVQDKLASAAYEPMEPSPAAMSAVMRADLAKYARLVKDAKIPAE